MDSLSSVNAAKTSVYIHYFRWSYLLSASGYSELMRGTGGFIPLRSRVGKPDLPDNLFGQNGQRARP